MARKRAQTQRSVGDPTPARIARDDAIAARYEGDPSPRRLYQQGDISREAYDRMIRHRAAGPPETPFRDLIAALRTERERLGLSLADVARRSGIDRAAVHKLEIGLNRNPTVETVSRYAEALGKRIAWAITDRTATPPTSIGSSGDLPA
jgi:DNA-binding phage protein